MQTERVIAGRLIPGDRIVTSGLDLVVEDVARVGTQIILSFVDSRRPMQCIATTVLIRKLRRPAP